MPNLSGNYTISELCNLHGVSAPYVRKIESYDLLPIPADGKVKGRRRVYSPKEAGIIADVLILRQLGFTFDEMSHLKQLEDEFLPLIRKALEPSIGADAQDGINTIFNGKLNGVLRLERLTTKERVGLLGKLQEHERLIIRIKAALANRITLLTNGQARVQVWLNSRTLLVNTLRTAG